jgi:hypothetical protein
MKKKGALFCIAAALFTLINASVWEGAASGSPGADLPETGYYVATNSFPRNTVVDITNLENGKTIRAVVSASLDNPGLLAVLSRDAAGAIGLPGRSIGRVRMSQPADPVAFSRFTEGLSSSGDPDHDPSAFVAANGINPELLPDEESASPAVQAPAVSGVEDAPPETGAGVIAGTGAVAADTGDLPEVTAETEDLAESGGTIDAVETGDAAEAIPPAEEPVITVEGFDETEPSIPEEETAAFSDKTGGESLEDTAVADLPELYVPPASPKPDEGITPETNPELVWVPQDEREDEELIEPKPEDRAEVTDIIAADTGEPEELAGTGEIIEPGEALAEDTPGPVQGAENFPGDYELTLAPSEDRPPESSDTVIPADQIFPPAAETETAMTPPPIEEEPLPPPGPAEPAEGNSFPVPVITKLEEGKYYLQLAASRNQDAVKTELAKIGEYMPLAIQVNERDSYPYRILVGPVNQGESRALLQKFKGTYQDAFVRVGN